MRFTGGETTVRAHVRTAREKTREAFVPLAFAPGEAMQIDWGEATIWLNGVKPVVNLFCARLDREALCPVPACRLDTAKRAEAKVSAFSMVRCDANSYSVPVQFCGKTVSIKALPERIGTFSEGQMIAVHQRCFGRRQSVYQLEHYPPFSRWTELFGNSIMAAALVDRLTFRSHILDMNGESFRLRSALV